MNLKSTNKFEITNDIEHNTKMLFEIEGLSETITLTVGNAFFVPKTEEDKDKPWRCTEITVDDKPVILFSTETTAPKTVYPYPALAFNYLGFQKIFEYSPPPKEFFICLKESIDKLVLENSNTKECQLIE